jgi:lipid II:glycine glycyltransferase (peptidoglycan interpeptide bridge formation enzyme)
MAGITEFTGENWNNKVSAVNQSFQHYTEWGEVKAASWGSKKYLYGEYPFQLLKKKFPKDLIKLGYIPPINIDSLRGEPLDNLLNELPQFSREADLDFLILELACTDATILSSAIKAGYREYFEDVQVRNTDVLDLALGEEQLFANLDGKYRREIRKAIKDGYTVTTYNKPEDTKKAVSMFYEIISSVIGRGNYTTYKQEYFEEMFNDFAKIDKAEIQICHHKDTPDKPLGAYLTLYDNTTAYELYGGTNLDGRKARIGFLLKWESILSTLDKGMKKYDQWGSAKLDASGGFQKSDHLYNIAVFKKGFGGNHVAYLPTLVYVNRPLKYFVYKVGMKIKPLFIKLIKATGRY